MPSGWQVVGLWKGKRMGPEATKTWTIDGWNATFLDEDGKQWCLRDD